MKLLDFDLHVGTRHAYDIPVLSEKFKPSQVFSDRKLISDILRELENPDPTLGELIVIAYRLGMEHRYSYSEESCVDRLLKTLADNVYQHRSVSIDDLDDLELKCNWFSILIDLQIIYGEEIKYQNISTWQFKYLDIVIVSLTEANKYINRGNSICALNIVSIVKHNVQKEFGYSFPSTLARVSNQIIEGMGL